MISFGGPHEPWDAPEPYASMYKPEDMPQPIPRAPMKENVPHGELFHMYGPGDSHAPSLTSRDIAELRANYAGNVTLIDDQIGEIVQMLKDKGQWDNTVVVFTSDHGEMNGDHGLLYKSNFLRSAVNVPLILRVPGIISEANAGTRYSGMVELFDVGATLSELAGGTVQSPSERQFAKSLVDVLKDPATIHRDTAISEISGETMIQNEEWKLALNTEGEAYLLYHLSEDPNEQNNLAGDPSAEPVINELKQMLLQKLLASQSKIILNPKTIMDFEHLKIKG